MIRPIETMYGGHRFRSRLEARWAVFLDALGVGWQYERQGFDLPSGPYLPDFWIPRIGGTHRRGLFVEVKGRPARADMDRAAELCAITGSSVAMVSELPKLENIHVATIDGLWTGTDLDGCGGWLTFLADERMPDGEWAIVEDAGFLWCTCAMCDAPGFEFEGRTARGAHEDGCPVRDPSGRGHGANNAKAIAAYAKAFGARFEHGEEPTPW